VRCDEVAVGAAAARTDVLRATIETVRRLPMRRTVARRCVVSDRVAPAGPAVAEG